MIQGIGFATPVLPYQTSPIVVAMVMGKIPFAGGAAFLPNYQAIGRFLQDGRPSNTERMTLPPPERTQSHSAKIVRQSRHLWTRDRVKVAEKIERFLGARQRRPRARPARREWE
jgi:hypothetical protein